ncbi:hypothetical protein SBBP2_420022 [Burkholderiales bacterium]|nr:hypothetical protein SBBP2_420022 [Burkholderiales bacterium]
MVVHARSEIGNYFECPSLSGAIKFQDLFLAFEVSLLILARHASIGDGLAGMILRRPI